MALIRANPRLDPVFARRGKKIVMLRQFDEDAGRPKAGVQLAI